MLIICSFQSFSMLYRTGCIYVPFPLRQFPSIKAKSGQACLFQFYFLKPRRKRNVKIGWGGEEVREGEKGIKFRSNLSLICHWVYCIPQWVHIDCCWKNSTGCFVPRSQNKSIIPTGRNSSKLNRAFSGNLTLERLGSVSFLSAKWPWLKSIISRSISHPPLSEE